MLKDESWSSPFNEEMINVQMLVLQIQIHVSPDRPAAVLYFYMDHIFVCPSDMQGISEPHTVLLDTVHVIFLCSLIPASSLQLKI